MSMNYIKHIVGDTSMSFPTLHHPIEKICTQLPTSGTYIAQPYGKLCYAWFTDSCTLIDRHTKKQWKVPVVFDSCIAGTIVSGTYTDKKYFVIDNIFYYQEKEVSGSYLEKINLLKKILTMYIQPSFFFLPEFASKSSYKIRSIKIIQGDTTYQYVPPKRQTFQVKSTPKSDIYELYKDNVFHSIACINTYSCSQRMNQLFHTTDTFIEKTITMECVWNESFKKWSP
jgi:hypothetical protein